MKQREGNHTKMAAMKTLLVLDSSARVNRSITRRLTGRIASAWSLRLPGAKVVARDVGARPPSFINEAWIADASGQAAANGAPAASPGLAESEALIHELFQASAVVMGVPMYNFGMPAQMKAYLDQVIRVGRTFSFDPTAENPYVPLIPPKPVIIITSKGASGYEPGGPLSHMNFLEPHLTAALEFVGLSDITFLRVEGQESKDGPFRKILAGAELTLDRLLDDLVRKLAVHS